MLAQLTLTNFRGFEHHVVPFRKTTVVVGRNNAGKSTIIEALRLVALVVSRLGNINYKEPPEWTKLSRRYRGVAPSLAEAGLDLTNAFHHYRDPPADIVAEFENGCRIRVLIGPKSAVHSIAYNQGESLITTRRAANQLALPKVAILPQIGPLSSEEFTLSYDRIRRTLDTPLASQHFRNQLHYFPEAVERFMTLVSETWPGVRINGIERTSDSPTDPLRTAFPKLMLLVQDKAYVGEACQMGHGLQMWLQIMWFL